MAEVLIWLKLAFLKIWFSKPLLFQEVLMSVDASSLFWNLHMQLLIPFLIIWGRGEGNYCRYSVSLAGKASSSCTRGLHSSMVDTGLGKALVDAKFTFIFFKKLLLFPLGFGFEKNSMTNFLSACCSFLCFTLS